jgi:amidophosphoribosyltransferase
MAYTDLMLCVPQKTEFKLCRGHGLVTDVFNPDDIKMLEGENAIGHTRYSTAGGKTQIEGFQPFSVRYRMGNLALAHNGNLSNAQELRSFFESQGVLMQSTVDSELFLHLISHSKRQSQLDQIFDAATQAEGAFSVIFMTDNFMCALRDPNGFRPLCIGKLAGRGPEGTDGYCVASETCALDLCKAEYVRDVEPGEMIVIDKVSLCFFDNWFHTSQPHTHA